MKRHSHAAPGHAAPAVDASGIVRFGTFALQLQTEQSFWADVMLRRFRAAPGRHPGVTPDVVVRVRPDWGDPVPAGGQDTLRVERTRARVRVLSDVMSLEVDDAARPRMADLHVHPRDRDQPYLEHFFAVLIHKLLQLCGVVRLHGAAVEAGGLTSVFVGGKGSGKSTIALAAGRAGGRVLADDHIVIRRGAGGIAVSGCDGNIRLTEASERHFFRNPLAAVAGDFGGVLKKEVPLAGLVLSIPYQNRAASRLYFPFVGDHLAVRPVSRRVAVERILNDIAPAHRFDGPADQWDIMQLVTDFVTPLACADLELSTTLLHIESLMDVLDS